MHLSSINPSDEFLRHAADCQQMARFTRDPASKATWSRMAERWRHCAGGVPEPASGGVAVETANRSNPADAAPPSLRAARSAMTAIKPTRRDPSYPSRPT